MTKTEKTYRANLREIRRLQNRIAEKRLGRNAGATHDALDRRLDRDRLLLARLAAEEDARLAEEERGW